MAVPKGKTRVMVTISKEMADRLDYYCEKVGTNRSAMCAQFIGQGIMGYDKAYEVVDKIANKITLEDISGLDAKKEIRKEITNIFFPEEQ